ncbi:hypothetical protein B0H11DRAFT_2204806 [Mycena galericulata]|nr:hypothetical protein B0H11DRAFT_2204806 [Mycena galericulata]
MFVILYDIWTNSRTGMFKKFSTPDIGSAQQRVHTLSRLASAVSTTAPGSWLSTSSIGKLGRCADVLEVLEVNIRTCCPGLRCSGYPDLLPITVTAGVSATCAGLVGVGEACGDVIYTP